MDSESVKFRSSRNSYLVSAKAKSPGRAIALGFLLFCAPLFPSPVPAAESAQPAVSPVPSPVPSVVAPVEEAPRKITQTEARSLLSAFKKAQATELKALEHRQKFDLKELKASHSARKKEWEAREKEARHTYFKENTKGKLRRVYVKEFIQRRKALLSIFGDERARRKNEHQVRRNAVVEEQRAKLKMFQNALDQGVEPRRDLWPSPGQ